MDLIGTRFEEEEKDKKHNVYNQKARDEKGRVRWQGAFTGGFVAGYHNTCGSREGYEPCQYKGKGGKVNRTKTVFDYMDEDDFGAMVLGKNIVVKEEFRDRRVLGQEILNSVRLDGVESFEDIRGCEERGEEERETRRERQGYQGLGGSGGQNSCIYRLSSY